ncbi:hypothetical protein V5O48_016913, partial [Marasmius crinis-equi]
MAETIVCASEELFEVLHVSAKLVIGFSASIIVLYGSYRYLRFIFPCTTPIELQRYQTQWEADVCIPLPVASPRQLFYGHEWNDYGQTLNKYRLRREASEIRVMNLNARSWSRYLGFHPGLVLRIIRWHSSAEELKRHILNSLEQLNQSYLDADRQRFEVTKFPSVPCADYTETQWGSKKHPSPSDGSLVAPDAESEPEPMRSPGLYNHSRFIARDYDTKMVP